MSEVLLKLPKSVGQRGGGGGGGGGGGKTTSADSRIAPNIEAMAWNGDFTQVALGSGKSIVIYAAEKAAKKTWTKTTELENNDGMTVSGLDWSPVTNYLVSCSHDRNAFVWTEKSAGVWKPTLAILRISRAALCCKWSPNGKKFAVGSGSKTVPVCQFDAEQDWWTSKIINKKKGSAVQHKSSIVSVAWHPNSQFLATASTDKKCRVFCAHNEDLDGELDSAAIGKLLPADIPAAELEFGDPLFEFSSNGWVHDCAFSPNGDTLAFVSHDSTVTLVNFSQAGEGGGSTGPLQIVLPYQGLPFNCCLFASDSQLIVAGHDFIPIRVDSKGSTWVIGESVDDMKDKEAAAPGSAKALFAARDTLGQDTKIAGCLSKHQAPIRCLRVNGKTLYSAGSDGRLQFWKL